MNKSMNEVTAWLKALVHDGAHLRLHHRRGQTGASRRLGGPPAAA